MTIHEILETYWGHKKFRPLQEEIIQSVIKGNDTLALLPTGGGKSICFQIPGIYLSGVTLVISPLIALMKDQVQNLKNKGIRAEGVFSGMMPTQIEDVINSCVYEKTKFLYVSPERLQNESFVNRLKNIRVTLIAIDEAHCISQWGYDFRPPYLKIAEIRSYFPDVPVVALTATATKKVVEDIQQKLLFNKPNAYKKSFKRDNLIYATIFDENKLVRLLQILESLKGSAIVYVRNRAKTKMVAEFLESNGISSHFYHAGLESRIRDEKQLDWIHDKVRVIVATNAFGMGIDKPNVRTVIHLDIPDSIEAYFQEAGRAGRDEERAVAIAIWNNADVVDLEKHFLDQYPPIESIKVLYESISHYLQIAEYAGADHTFTVFPFDFMNKFKLTNSLFFNGIKFLERQGYLAFNDVETSFSKVHFHLDDINYDALNETQTMIIKTLLRNYEGLFNSPVKINEKIIAKKCELPEEKIIHQLTYLSEIGMIKYYPPSKGFSITYLQDRVPLQFFNLSAETYEERKKNALEKMESIKQYFIRNDKCRSRILLEYFGETTSSDCGKCDVCKNKLTNNSADNDFKNLVDFLYHFEYDQIHIQELYKLQPSVKKHSGALLKWCIDKELLSMLPENKLHIHKKNLQKLI